MQLLGLLAARQLVGRDEPVAERRLRRGAMDAHDGRVGDERNRAGSGDELAQPFERAELMVDPRRGENHTVGIGCDGVRRLAIQRPALLEQLAELDLVLREWTIAAAHTLPRGVDLDLDEHRQRAVGKRVSHRRCLDGAAAERNHGRGGLQQRVAHDRGFDDAKLQLAVFREEGAERQLHPSLDQPVGVDCTGGRAARRPPRPASSSPRP